MASTTGRAVRFFVGAFMILVGLAWVGGSGGWILATIGLLPLIAGALDFCAFAPLFRLPMSGRRIRAAH